MVSMIPTVLERVSQGNLVGYDIFSLLLQSQRCLPLALQSRRSLPQADGSSHGQTQ